MFFSTIHFFLFFLIVFIAYWIICPKKVQCQNIILLISSCYFYAYFNWIFLLLLLVCIAIYYLLGQLIYKEKREKRKEYFMWIGLLAGIGMLAYFKYMNFFISSIVSLANDLHFFLPTVSLEIIAPIGISFYTFKFISYLVDIYNEEYKPQENIMTFGCYILFFPSVVSGPIDRPQNLIPQLANLRIFQYPLAVDGCRQILWGVFKKWIIADNCAFIVNDCFNNINDFNGSTLLLGGILFLIQIYADFSGYSDMAIGIGKLLGIKLTINFHYPFFATNIADFWRRWHISLTSWMTDYIFTPLSFYWRRFKKTGIIGAVIVNFIVVGFWHGGNWTFIVYGLLNGLLFIPLILRGTMNTQQQNYRFIRVIFTFLMMSLLVILFRSDSLSQALTYYQKIFSISLFSIPQIENKIIFIFTFIMLITEWANRNKEHGFDLCSVKKPLLRYSIYFIIALLCFLFKGEVSEFIYQQY